MCIIIAKTKGVDLPTHSQLSMSFDNNPHGCGIAYYKDSFYKTKIAKGFTKVKELIDFMAAESIDKDTSFIIHFRWATAGLKDSINHHPFPITNRASRMEKLRTSSDFAFAHNGTFFDLKHHEKYSDTFLFGKTILSDMLIKNNLDDPTISKLLVSYLGTNKIAILNKHSIYLFGDFITDNGISFSNDSYKNNLYRYDYAYANTSAISTRIDYNNKVSNCMGCGCNDGYISRWINGTYLNLCWQCHVNFDTYGFNMPELKDCDYCGKPHNVKSLIKRKGDYENSSPFMVCEACINLFEADIEDGLLSTYSGARLLC